MKVSSPRFVTSAFNSAGYPDHNLREVAFVGRSNVGKSSMINKILNHKKLARTSSQPGRTQSINFYNIDNRFFLVDLPGYGFARVPNRVKKEWGNLINNYLSTRSSLAGIVQIVDARHKPTADDRMMVDWLRETGLPTIIAATKVDKISRGQQHKQKNIIYQTLELEDEMDFCYFSAKTGEGKDKIISFILDVTAG